MPTPWGRTEFDGVDETQLYSQKRLNVKSSTALGFNSAGKLSSARRRAIFPCSHYRHQTFGTFGKFAATSKVPHLCDFREFPIPASLTGKVGHELAFRETIGYLDPIDPPSVVKSSPFVKTHQRGGTKLC